MLLIPTSMTLNGVIALILLANYVTLVEETYNVRKILSPVQCALLAINNPPCSAVSAIAELLVLCCPCRLLASSFGS